MSNQPIEIDIDELVLADVGVDVRELEDAIEAELAALRSDPSVGSGPGSGPDSDSSPARRIARSVLARLEHGERGGGGDQ